MSEDDSKPTEGARQDPFVERVRPDPAARPIRTITFSGLAGRSDRPGYRRLYLSRDLTRYVEFLDEDVVWEERIPAEEPPVVGLEATRVQVRRDATIDQVLSRNIHAVDEFDLDVRLGSPSLRPIDNPTWAGDCTWGTDCGGGETNFGLTCAGTCDDTCQITLCRGRTCVDICETRLGTCDTCATDCNQATCGTCNTQCNQATCATCNQATCATCNQATCATCNQATCATCATDCGQGTCQTCATDCRGRTCVTCDTCNPHIPTCGRQC